VHKEVMCFEISKLSFFISLLLKEHITIFILNGKWLLESEILMT